MPTFANIFARIWHTLEYRGDMAYSEIAIELRRCLEPECNNWALWAAPDQRCRWHTTWAYAAGKLPAPTCRCDAYQWPHRPGGGLCRWPDVPEGKCSIPAGTRKTGKRRRGVVTFRYDAAKDPIEKLERWLHEQSKQKG